jgi:SPP1 gp7 family putative phage head morphogenesis protein
MPRRYDLGALARSSGQRRNRVGIRPIGSRSADTDALRVIIVGVIDGGAEERAALLMAARGAQSRLTNDDLGFRDAMRQFRTSQDTRLGRAKGAIVGFVNRVIARFDGRWVQAVKAAIGIDISTVAQASDLQPTAALIVQKITAGIQGLASDVADGIEAGLISLIVSGGTAKAQATLLLERVAKARKAAGRAAKGEMEALNAVLNEFRQTQAGITEYEWWTREDERVRGNPGGLYPKARPSHYARHGQVFAWARPPERGHPGQDYGCRCVARGIVRIRAEAVEPTPSRARAAGLRAVASELGLSL